MSEFDEYGSGYDQDFQGGYGQDYYGGYDQDYGGYEGEQFGIEVEEDLLSPTQISYSDTLRTSYSSIFETNHKYLVLGIRTMIKDKDYISEDIGTQLISVLSDNETNVQNIDFLNPGMLVYGFYVIKKKIIDEKQLKKLVQKEKNIQIDDVIRYAKLIIEKFL